MSERLTLADLRRLGLCASGARAFCARHGIDWRAARREGVALARLEATGDAMALAVVRRLRGRKS